MTGRRIVTTLIYRNTSTTRTLTRGKRVRHGGPLQCSRNGVINTRFFTTLYEGELKTNAPRVNMRLNTNHLTSTSLTKGYAQCHYFEGTGHVDRLLSHRFFNFLYDREVSSPFREATRRYTAPTCQNGPTLSDVGTGGGHSTFSTRH